MTVYRLAKQRYAQDLSGHGARRVGGRCNPVGVAAIYTSENISLAVLEVLVHLDKQDIPDDYVLMAIQLGIGPVDASDARQALEIARVNPVISVPSAVVSRERNIVIYPELAGFHVRITDELSIAWTEPVPLRSAAVFGFGGSINAGPYRKLSTSIRFVSVRST